MAGRHPVLVDFQQSILVASEIIGSAGGSVIRRGKSGSWKSKIMGVLLPTNTIAAKNAARLKELLSRVSDRPNILIIGGGSRGHGTDALYDASELRLIGFDIYASPLTQFIADGHHIPLADHSVDAVWIQAVLEHVLDPWRVVAEIYRVLKKDGFVYAETPFMQQVHEGPYDFTRFTESGHRWLFKRFEVIAGGVVLGPASQLLWTIEHITRGIFRSVRAGTIAKSLLFWLRYIDKIIPESYAVDNASAVFFLGRKSTQEVQPKEMVSYYKGAHRRAPLVNAHG